MAKLAYAIDLGSVTTVKFSLLLPSRLKKAENLICARGGTGRRVGFRFQFREECRFDSCRAHQKAAQLKDLSGFCFCYKNVSKFIKMCKKVVLIFIKATPHNPTKK